MSKPEIDYRRLIRCIGDGAPEADIVSDYISGFKDHREALLTGQAVKRKLRELETAKYLERQETENRSGWKIYTYRPIGDWNRLLQEVQGTENKRNT